MDKLLISGGKKLYGEIKIQGSKNAALPILAATVMIDGKIVLDNVPRLIDVYNMLEILSRLGIRTKFENNSVLIDASNVKNCDVKSALAKELRSSVFLLGAILSRKKEAIVAYPGGCDIGLRPIDIHIKALKELGVKIEETAGYIKCNGKNARAGDLCLDYPSVGATENVMLASVFLKGKTTILNAAREPEIIELQEFLNRCGAKISGAGTSKITIEGVERLIPCVYRIGYDRIALGTYAIAVATIGGKIGIKGASWVEMNSLLFKLIKNSCNITYENGIIYIIADGRNKSVKRISTQPYPGFATDLQAPFMVMQAVAEGTCVLTENIFENRFRHVSELRKMGADIIIEDRTAIIRGVDKLFGTDVYAKDLRGGAGLVVAGLVAEGDTVLNDLYHVDRGYENIEKTFAELGAEIKRI